MLKTYPAIFHTEEVGYSVTFPTFNGGTQGDSLEETMEEAKDFLSSIIAYYIDEDLTLPDAPDIRSIILADTTDFVTLIQANPMPYIRGNKTIRKNVTIPEWLAKKAEKEQINFSETLTEALYKKFG
ncbi:type II toxin-antitoxin system HicB family antitoxin [Enterococcus sp.]|uniref:type II toxin-antitoxin system HicB family antitoxin n=1 Tax=Enterococcus sp. TaxID=35783 RepID=UPI0028995B57|nr:type II toxin-antitoxin system HicB family antitoxin [Enterococcus sp.]